jgi:NAD+ diphosphatase
MLAFQADYAGGSLRPDPDEIEDARFFRFDALPRVFPGNVSIGQWLLRLLAPPWDRGLRLGVENWLRG